MADLANAIGGFEKLNEHNYEYWRLCIEAYLQGQDSWEIVGGNETTATENAEALCKWRIKAGGEKKFGRAIRAPIIVYRAPNAFFGKSSLPPGEIGASKFPLFDLLREVKQHLR
ncbi:hypothetical protein L1049_017458 [Liquidambar formosana]|uniref:DUF4219 domain-containing protein n=1 Tax=Liquidambar formosana TaxID=63359 RepID=A0AAP0S1V4_LIQFO